ncbi:MAG: hypothetical protein VX099_03055, partial [Pseudomonadota bacterium]|nr:hypothetical protein [Pseudomonadota bacterium]
GCSECTASMIPPLLPKHKPVENLRATPAMRSLNSFPTWRSRKSWVPKLRVRSDARARLRASRLRSKIWGTLSTIACNMAFVDRKTKINMPQFLASMVDFVIPPACPVCRNLVGGNDGVCAT